MPDEKTETPEGESKEQPQASSEATPEGASADTAAEEEGSEEDSGKTTKAIGLVVGLLIVTVVGLQLLNRGSEEARRAQDAANLGLIAKALEQYVAKKGEMPKRLEELYDENFITDPSVFAHPSSDFAPYDGSGDLIQNDYIYLPQAQAKTNDPVAFSRAIAPRQTGRNVLLANGKVEWMEEEAFRKRILAWCKQRNVSLVISPETKASDRIRIDQLRRELGLK